MSHKQEPILAKEEDFQCLFCDTQFRKLGTAELVCPNCGACGEDNIVPIEELQEEEHS